MPSYYINNVVGTDKEDWQPNHQDPAWWADLASQLPAAWGTGAFDTERQGHWGTARFLGSKNPHSSTCFGLSFGHSLSNAVLECHSICLFLWGCFLDMLGQTGSISVGCENLALRVQWKLVTNILSWSNLLGFKMFQVSSICILNQECPKPIAANSRNTPTFQHPGKAQTCSNAAARNLQRLAALHDVFQFVHVHMYTHSQISLDCTMKGNCLKIFHPVSGALSGWKAWKPSCPWTMRP